MSKDGPAALPFPGLNLTFSPNGELSNVTLDIRSAASSVESARFSLVSGAGAADEDPAPGSLEDPTEPGLLASPSILLIPNAQRSR